MTTHTRHEGFYFYLITVTCFKWLPIIHEANLYPYFNTFFKNLSKKGVNISGYVIMPNHFHLLVCLSNLDINLSQVIGEGKRFLAYKIVKNLKKINKFAILKEMEMGVSINEKRKGKKHQVFRLSFDAKGLEGTDSIENILEYIHNNPNSGKWNLIDDITDYPYSSASFYEKGVKNTAYLIHFDEVEY